MKRIIIAGAGSGTGKTLITMGLLWAFKEKGLKVNSYKCGPDYIDPMFHKHVLGIASENIDTFFSDQAHLNKLLSYGKDFDISIIEGVMGIYDGLGGFRPEGSAYDLACKTNTPIILLVKAKGMGRTLISIIKGILMDDTQGLIKGIILNQISPGYYKTIAPVISKETGINVIGFLSDINQIKLESRHLGLYTPAEIGDLTEQISYLGKQISSTVDLDQILSISNIPDITFANTDHMPDITLKTVSPQKCRLAVAFDQAFCFYYEENLRLFKENGIEIVYFSPINDKKLPEDISGLYLGGGYPELYLDKLSHNTSMLISIREALLKGLPSIAECGGFMYLHETIIDKTQKEYPMVGVIPGNCFNTGKLCRFGYVEVSVDGLTLKGHEFHYYDTTQNGKDCEATKPVTQKKWRFGMASKSKYWGFPHLYFASNQNFVSKFAQAMLEYTQSRINKNWGQ